jgi:hypothetical protein
MVVIESSVWEVHGRRKIIHRALRCFRCLHCSLAMATHLWVYSSKGHSPRALKNRPRQRYMDGLETYHTFTTCYCSVITCLYSTNVRIMGDVRARQCSRCCYSKLSERPRVAYTNEPTRICSSPLFLHISITRLETCFSLTEFHCLNTGSLFVKLSWIPLRMLHILCGVVLVRWWTW